MLLPSMKYDFTILQRVIMTLILLKTIHTLHHKNRKNKYYPRFTSIFYPIICWLVINTFLIVFFPLVPQGLMRPYKQAYKQQVTPS